MNTPPISPKALLECLNRRIPLLERRLCHAGFSLADAEQAAEQARDVAIEAILSGRAAAMAPAARWRWLQVVAYHAAVTLKRRNRKKALPPDMEDARRGDPEEAAEHQKVRSAFERLPPDGQSLIVAVIFEKQSLRAAAREFGLAPSTLRRRLEGALDAIRRELQKSVG